MCYWIEEVKDLKFVCQAMFILLVTSQNIAWQGKISKILCTMLWKFKNNVCLTQARNAWRAMFCYMVKPSNGKTIFFIKQKANVWEAMYDLLARAQLVKDCRKTYHSFQSMVPCYRPWNRGTVLSPKTQTCLRLNSIGMSFNVTHVNREASFPPSSRNWMCAMADKNSFGSAVQQ